MVSESCGLPSPSTNSESGNNNFNSSSSNRLSSKINPVVNSSSNSNIYSAVVINGNNNNSSSSSLPSSSSLIHNNLINMSHHIGHNSTNHIDHMSPRSLSSSPSVVGLILWPEGSFSVQQHSNSTNCTLKPSSSSSLSPFSTAFSRGLVLGSILLDNKESTMFADELRQLVTGQIPNITFGFLSKEGWVIPFPPTNHCHKQLIYCLTYHGRLQTYKSFNSSRNCWKSFIPLIFYYLQWWSGFKLVSQSDQLSQVGERGMKKYQRKREKGIKSALTQTRPLFIHVPLRERRRRHKSGFTHDL